MDNETLRKVQLIQLDMLLEVNKICNEYNINYYLIGGSALGAVRHKGFIPWDEDIDIGMMRNDYDRFLEVSNDLFDDRYFLQTNKTDPKYPILYAKIRANNTTFIEKESKKMGSEMHQGIFIDVFPIDNVPDNIFLEKMQYVCVYFLISIASTRFGNYPQNRYKKFIKNLYSKIFITLFEKKTLDKMTHNIASSYKNIQTKKVSNLFGRYNEKETVPRSYFGKGKYLEFEGYNLPVPEYYHDYLRHIYGEYMVLPPIEKRSIHNIEYVDLEMDYIEYFKNK